MPRARRQAPRLSRCPPLIITESQIDEVLRRFGLALEETAQVVAG